MAEGTRLRRDARVKLGHKLPRKGLASHEGDTQLFTEGIDTVVPHHTDVNSIHDERRFTSQLYDPLTARAQSQKRQTNKQTNKQTNRTTHV